MPNNPAKNEQEYAEDIVSGREFVVPSNQYENPSLTIKESYS